MLHWCPFHCAPTHFYSSWIWFTFHAQRAKWRVNKHFDDHSHNDLFYKINCDLEDVLPIGEKCCITFNICGCRNERLIDFGIKLRFVVCGQIYCFTLGFTSASFIRSDWMKLTELLFSVCWQKRNTFPCFSIYEISFDPLQVEHVSIWCTNHICIACKSELSLALLDKVA